MAVDYKFNEKLLVEEIMDYINSTYGAHYGANGLQSSEVIVDRGRGLDFFLGNIDKYNGRYGSKGDSPDDYRKDLMKIVHYGILSLYEHDRRYERVPVEEESSQTQPIDNRRSINDPTPEEWDLVSRKQKELTQELIDNRLIIERCEKTQVKMK
tara:strand:- start:2355 stop:2816 length:462 start_codon:yes stop_codon:yes gene_type:complete